MKKAIITIHGIHTRQLVSWQTKFWSLVKDRNPDVKVFQYEYGFFFAPVSWWVALSNTFKIPSFIRSHAVKRFVNFINKVQAEFPDYEISIIAHSFGTYVTHCAMERDKTIRIKNLVLVGGVISCHIENLDLLEWMEWGRIKAIHNWSSHNDDVVGAIAIPPFGKLGYRGFVRHGNKDDYLEPTPKPYPADIFNHHTQENHSGVLVKLDQYGQMLVDQLLN